MTGRSNAPKQRKTCVQCGNEFLPNSGRQRRCEDCAPYRPQYKPSQKPRMGERRPERDKGYEGQRRRRKRRGQISPALALDIEESVARRVAAMTDEEDDGATGESDRDQ